MILSKDNIIFHKLKNTKNPMINPLNKEKNALLINLLMVQFIQANELKINVMVLESKFGLMALNMKILIILFISPIILIFFKRMKKRLSSWLR